MMPFIYHYILLISLGVIEILLLFYNFKRKNDKFFSFVDPDNKIIILNLNKILGYRRIWERKKESKYTEVVILGYSIKLNFSEFDKLEILLNNKN